MVGWSVNCGGEMKDRLLGFISGRCEGGGREREG